MKQLIKKAGLISFILSSKAVFAQDIINCNGTQGTMVQNCSVAQKELVSGIQPFDSGFYINYKMTCNRGGGPKLSKVKVMLENNHEVFLSYNTEAADVFVGTGKGPLIVLDSQSNELLNLRFKDCQLSFSNIRVEMGAAEKTRRQDEQTALRKGYADYLTSVTEQSNFNRPLMLNQQSTLYFRTKQRVDAQCLIETWSTDDIFDDVVADMITRFTASFGELSGAGLNCKEKTYPELTLAGMKCSIFNLAGVNGMLANQDLPKQNRYFFETCLGEINYLSLLHWFENQSKDLAEKIQNSHDSGFEDISKKLKLLKTDIDTLVSKSCTAETCQTKTISIDTIQ